MKNLRLEVIKYSKMLNSKKLSALRSGNISIRYKDGLEVPLEIYPSNAFSCEIEFKRLDRF